jgi:iron complex transport system ATP-binding protein
MLRIENLSFSYNGIPALSNIDFGVESGEIVSLIGPNGSGKSTLLKVISGLLSPESGAVSINELNISKYTSNEIARMLAFLEQDHHIGFDFSTRELIEWGRIPHRSRMSSWRPEDERAVERAMEVTQTRSFESRSIFELSGGEKQRVFLAMALAQEPELLLLDEPTAHLDLRYQIEILEVVEQLAKNGMTVLMAIHDLQLAARVSNKVAVLSEGVLVAQGHAQEIIDSQLLRKVWQIDAVVKWEDDELMIRPSRVGVSL